MTDLTIPEGRATRTKRAAARWFDPRNYAVFGEMNHRKPGQIRPASVSTGMSISGERRAERDRRWDESQKLAREASLSGAPLTMSDLQKYASELSKVK